MLQNQQPNLKNLIKVQRLRLTLINGVVVGQDYVEVEEEGDI